MERFYIAIDTKTPEEMYALINLVSLYALRCTVHEHTVYLFIERADTLVDIAREVQKINDTMV